MNTASTSRTITALLCLVAWSLIGCASQRERLSFPTSPSDRNAHGMFYCLNGAKTANFAILNDNAGRLRQLAYDDDDDGEFDRALSLGEERAENIPHLIIMLDSVPYSAVADRYAAGQFTWFDPPQKVIPPFPTMSGVIFTSIMHAPPLPGMINRYYNRATGKTDNMIVRRAMGHDNPWHSRLDYHCKYWENGLSFLWPRHWFRRELARAKRAFDESDKPVTVVYFASTAGMLSRFGEQGLDEVLQGLEQLCAQILHDRGGAVHISALADHGHNLMPGQRIELEKRLRDAGFHPTSRMRKDLDVVIENDGMVNYIGMHTQQPAQVADALLTRDEVQLVVYKENDRVIVRNERGSAAIEHRERRFRYVSLDADVLEYESVKQCLQIEDKMDADSFAADRDWFEATVDHEWPDAPPRLWKAFDGLTVNTPDLMITLDDGYCTGMGFLEMFISMASTHGGLNQLNSATFIMTTTGRANRSMRSDEILPCIAPGLIEDFASRNTCSESE
jgi:hypothetical protein